MKRYCSFLSDGLQSKGHDTKIVSPKAILSKNGMPKQLKKWLRYMDSFVLFPIWLFIESKRSPKSTLYVITDQALGMWVPVLKSKKHVVHCHDFTALKSSLGLMIENPTSWTGKKYQNLILKGFSQASNFICISKNTEKELLHFLHKPPHKLGQVYNALDPIFKCGDIVNARNYVSKHLGLNVQDGYLMHVGGNDFYKNRTGVIALYNSWREQTNSPVPLLMIGYEPSEIIQRSYDRSPYKDDIHLLIRVDNELLLKAYQGCRLFLFPSLTEGFGWPVAEAMACGCPVITTNRAPMNEVGGDAAIYIERCPSPDEIISWATASAKIIEATLQLTENERNTIIKKGLEQSKKFNGKDILNEIEVFYQSILD
ncbi:mannosyl transferase [Maribacter sp. 6B07]|uniref:glycosyltransferase family 4 protein n=1 Tax=Maribacter sp. 6B07 TaxID=2045442 RepID=UPI000C075616|nr:glycosyltransferase family 1 protein [Maribacter sp. 6B07]PHN94582.1 mannosyl transferase [Maribacter sp. 6B07]